MRRTVFCFVVVCLSMALSAPAWATWSKFTAAGSGLGIGTPSCAQLATNKVACAVLSGTDTMMVNVFNGKWGKWTSITGTVSSVPSCTSDGDGNVFCAATTGAGLEVATYNGSKWSAPVAVSGTLYSAPSCANISIALKLSPSMPQPRSSMRSASQKLTRSGSGETYPP